MFTYTSLFLVSLLVAIVARVMFKKAQDASGSVYNTKLPNAELAHLETQTKHQAKTDDGVDTAYPTDLRGRGTYAYLTGDEASDQADGIDFQIAEDTPHEWPESVHAVPVNHASPAKASGHCSLYELDPTEAEAVEEPAAAWPVREDRVETGGKAYKVTRKPTPKVATEGMSLETDGKPWGW